MATIANVHVKLEANVSVKGNVKASIEGGWARERVSKVERESVCK